MKKTTTTVGLLLSVAQAITSMAWADAGTHRQGYNMGQNNGTVMVNRVAQRTLDERGCSALKTFENTLLNLTQTIRPNMFMPASDDDFVRGFYQGYSDSIREGVRQARIDCNRTEYYNGRFPGRLAGTVFCRVYQDVQATHQQFVYQPLYEGWAGNERARRTCAVHFERTVTECAGRGIVEASAWVRDLVCQ